MGSRGRSLNCDNSFSVSLILFIILIKTLREKTLLPFKKSVNEPDEISNSLASFRSEYLGFLVLIFSYLVLRISLIKLFLQMTGVDSMTIKNPIDN